MYTKKRILALTGIRSDYDLMSGLYQKITEDSELELGLIVSGAHLSETYGYTVKEIEKDGIPIIAKIESLLDSNSRAARLKSASIAMQNAISAMEAYNPDLIIYAGDREDVMIGALMGAYLGIPTLHFFGGDHTTDGHVDNPVRHATSKLSSIHFVVHNQHKDRLLKMGEKAERIFVIGSPALDKFHLTPKINKAAIKEVFERPEWDNYCLLIFHPILGYEKFAGDYFDNILNTLIELNINAFVSYPNIDSGNKTIIQIIEKHKDNDRFIFYKNLDRDLFINIMRNADFMIGNSSAGIYEAPIIPLGVVNVGVRQQSRINAGNVIFVEQDRVSIKRGIRHVLSEEFQKQLKRVESIYGDGQSSVKALKLIKEIDFDKYRFKTEDPLNE